MPLTVGNSHIVSIHLNIMLVIRPYIATHRQAEVHGLLSGLSAKLEMRV